MNKKFIKTAAAALTATALLSCDHSPSPAVEQCIRTVTGLRDVPNAKIEVFRGGSFVTISSNEGLLPLVTKEIPKEETPVQRTWYYGNSKNESPIELSELSRSGTGTRVPTSYLSLEARWEGEQIGKCLRAPKSPTGPTG